MYDLKQDVVSGKLLTAWYCLVSLSLSLSPPSPPPLPQLVTKVKLYRVVNSQVLATHSIALDSLNLVDEKGVAKTIVR